MTTNLDPLLYYGLASDVLTVVVDAIKKTDAGLSRDARTCVVPAIQLGRCCPESIQVAVTNVYASTAFPTEDRKQEVCGGGPIAVVMTIGVYRCAAVVAGDDLSPPTCDTLDDEAKTTLIDAWTVRHAVSCFLAPRQPELGVLIGRTNFLDATTVCMGSELPVTIGYNDSCDCTGFD